MTDNPPPWRRNETFLHDLLRQYRTRPHHDAVIARRAQQAHTEVLTYRDLTIWAARIHRTLLARGVGRGDRIAVQIGNRWEIAALAYATVGIGAVLVPVPPDVGTAELLHRLDLVEPTVFIVEYPGSTPPATDVVAAVHERWPALDIVVIGDRGGGGDEQNPFGTNAFDQTLGPWPTPEDAHTQLAAAADALDPDAPTLILFTSGTTGPSKAVVHSNNSLYAALHSYIGNFDLTSDTVIGVTTPVVHYSGLVQGLFTTTIVGATTAIQDVRDPAQFLALVESAEVDVLYGPPHTLLELAAAQRVDPSNIFSLERVIVGSAPVVSTLIEAMDEVFGARTSSLWGMSEFGPAVLTPGDAPVDLPARSNGTPIAGVEVRIDPDQRSTPAERVGRLFVRGATRALGYYTQQARFEASIDDHGWFDTGDIARDLGDNGIRVLGRAADIIWSGDRVVPAVELEAAVQLLDGISEASVIDTADGTLTAVVSRTDPPAPVDPTVDAVRARLSADGFHSWLPTRLIVMDRLPKTTTGKVRKHDLRNRYSGFADAAAGSNPAAVTAS